MALEVGAILDGIVVNITNFGAFIDMDGKTGLVHISEVAENYVKDINEVLKSGDKVKVKVLSVDPNGKISLSIKQAQERKEQKPREFKQKSFRPREDNFTNKKKDAPLSFEDMMKSFQKDSEEKLSEYKRRQEGTNGNKKRRS